MDYAAQAGDVVALLDRLGVERAVVLGHSMGGKTAMATALLHPGRVSALAIIDIAPVAYRHRSFARYIEAMSAMDLAAVTRRDDADRMLQPAEDDAFIRGFLLQNLASQEGAWRWRSNLDGLLAAMPDLLDWPLALNERRFDGPVLALAGERSAYVDATGEAGLLHLFGDLRLERVEGAGHWPHAERPDAVVSALRRFLEANP
jgi:esterase